MIGLGPPGRIRPWRLSSTVTALRAAFPGAKVHIRHCDPRAGFADFAVSEPVTITEESRELLSMTTSWGPRRLRVAAEILNACEHEEAIAALIAGVAPRMQRGARVDVGEIRQAEAKKESGLPSVPGDPDLDLLVVAQPDPATIQRGPRLGPRARQTCLQSGRGSRPGGAWPRGLASHS